MEYGNNILIPFDMIYDIDIGIFKLMKSSYKNPIYIHAMMLCISNNNFKYFIINSKTYDPLNILLRDDCKGESIDILNDLIEEDYERIVELSEPTDILGLLSVYLKSSLVKITILCTTEEESNKIKNTKLLENAKVIIQKDYSKINMDEYDSLFIKKYTEVLRFKKLQGKSIFIGNYKFNQDEENTTKSIYPLKDISMLVGDTNRLYFIDLYTTDDTYPIYG